MDPVTGEFNFTRLEKVTFGPGKAASLGPELERRGLKRALIVTGKTLGGSRLLDKVTAAAGSRLAGVFKGASQHVPSHTVAALVEEYKRSGADCMVSFGGGSPIDTVKVAAKRILEGDRPGFFGRTHHRLRSRRRDGRARPHSYRDADDAVGRRVHADRRGH